MEPPSAYDRGSRPRPGRRDINELRNLARSQPELVRDENPYNQNPNRASQRYQQPPQQQPRRPGKRPVDQELARSVPDLNRQLSSGTDSQVTRQPSFLRAQGDASDDNESLHEVFQREKSKRELALELEQHYPSNNVAPPPYDYNNVAPPAYSPSDISETDYMGRKPSGGSFGAPDFHRPPPSSNSSRNSRPPQERGYYNPDREYTPRGSSSTNGGAGYEGQRFPPRYPPTGSDQQDPQYFPAPPSSVGPPSSPYASSASDHHFAPHHGGFSPPQNAYIDEDEMGDYPDGDMTLV